MGVYVSTPYVPGGGAGGDPRAGPGRDPGGAAGRIPAATGQAPRRARVALASVITEAITSATLGRASITPTT